MGVFKDLAIQEFNQKISTALECSVCGGYNETASNFCFKCVGKYGGKTCGFCGVWVGSTGEFKHHDGCANLDWQVYIKEYGGKTCDFCGVSVGTTGGFKCHDGCNEVYCAEHITKYGGGVK